LKKIKVRKKADLKEIEKHIERMQPEERTDEHLDILDEQLEKRNTTLHCAEAETDLKKIMKNPERYIEINIIKKSRVVDTFFIFADKKTFHYKDKRYEIIEEVVYLLPRRGYFVPTCFYREGTAKPVGFRQTNKGITGKALSLLYRHRLYETLLRTEDKNMNIFIIIFNILTLIIFGVAMYFLFNPSTEETGHLIEATIMPFLGWF
jgi:hypothetical protein